MLSMRSALSSSTICLTWTVAARSIDVSSASSSQPRFTASAKPLVYHNLPNSSSLSSYRTSLQLWMPTVTVRSISRSSSRGSAAVVRFRTSYFATRGCRLLAVPDVFSKRNARNGLTCSIRSRSSTTAAITSRWIGCRQR